MSCVAAGLVMPVAQAEFSLNFEPVRPGPNTAIRTFSIHGADTIPNQTPFLMEGPFQLPELIEDPESGGLYYHMIVGDMADGFIQETFIQAGFRNFPGGPSSASPGDGDSTGGNGRDPLNRDPSIDTANGEGNPKKVLIRQIITDGEITMEYLKDKYDKKALITQSISATDLNSEFAIDMRNSTYDDMSTAGEITNRMDIPSLGSDGLGSFDMATNAQNTFVTGGRYTYSDGPKVGSSGGTYDYYDGGFDHANQNWELFFDFSQDNPWSYPDNRPSP